MSDLDLSTLEAAANERTADGLSGMNVSPPTVLALIAELRNSRARIAEVEAEHRFCTQDVANARESGKVYRDRALAAEQKVAALAEVIEQVRTLAEDPERHLVRWIDDSHLVDVSDLKGILDAAPTPPAEAPVSDRPSGLTVHEVGKQVAAAYQSGLADARRNDSTPPAEAEDFALTHDGHTVHTDEVLPCGCSFAAEFDGHHCPTSHPTPPTTDAEEARDDG